MPLSFERFVAFRYLRSRRKEAFVSVFTVLSILGVAISVLVLDVVLSVMTGFEGELRKKLIGANAHVEVRGFGGQFLRWEEIKETILKVEGVESAFPYTFNQAMLAVSGAASGVAVRGVVDEASARKKLQKYIESAALIDRLFASAEVEIVRPDGLLDTVAFPPLIVGRALARSFRLIPDTPVTVFSPRLLSSPQGLVPKQRRFAVVGSYSSGLEEYEKHVAYTSLKAAQSFFGLGESITGIEVVLTDIFQAQVVGERIVQSLKDFEGSYYVTDWTKQNKPLWDAMRLEQRVYFIVLLLLILVASFSVVSTLIMVVMEKGRDIAVLKSLGASADSVLKIFLAQGALIAVAGIVLGTVLGIGGCLALRSYGFEIDQTIFAIDTVPVYMIPSNFILVAASSFIITSLAGIYPALRAAKLDPVEALRYE